MRWLRRLLGTEHILEHQKWVSLAVDRLRVRVHETALNVETIMRNMDVYNKTVADLAAKVAALNTVEQSAVALIQGLRAQINQLIVDSDGIVPVEELQKVSSAIDVGTKALADAVAANTEQPAPVPDTLPPPAPVPDTPPPSATEATGQAPTETTTGS